MSHLQKPSDGVAPAGSSPHGQAEQFTKSTLSRRDLHPTTPTPQFNSWFSQAQASSIPQPEACTLSTAELPSGRVSSRIVYLKELDAAGGFVVYSNFGTSRKAADLATNPHAALVFFWAPLQRQSQVLEPDGAVDGDDGRAQLEGWVADAEKRFEGREDIPVPDFWGGLRIVPTRVEFWQGRQCRLHDRFVYVREEGRDGEDDKWTLERLSP
ncbi:hypothetical protein H634G_04395 [Metarhizium anisopliae BRIP 53293]|uniref:pyridoxal 5'-phosphate synthase n=1 Tax=Metarhizium anisopliae BRIP 53293 TaxID=1291518 RepID=A0A0D9P241_METAN|nr:hypothetical protein H634G_04395 [Metarhizium anisopliae BRIP 53293]KJK92906.1 hypothetical protein H633G_03282 [Metarhizium anisopliae BRIP 53284]